MKKTAQNDDIQYIYEGVKKSIVINPPDYLFKCGIKVDFTKTGYKPFLFNSDEASSIDIIISHNS